MSGDGLHGVGVARASSGVGPLPGDQPAVPGQDGVGRGERGDAGQQGPADFPAPDGQPAALPIRESKSTRAEHLPKDAVLLPQVLDGVLFVAVEPFGKRENQESDLDRERSHGPGILPRFRGKFCIPRAFERLNHAG